VRLVCLSVCYLYRFETWSLICREEHRLRNSRLGYLDLREKERDKIRD
jgi:hypothetical protein